MGNIIYPRSPILTIKAPIVQGDRASGCSGVRGFRPSGDFGLQGLKFRGLNLRGLGVCRC